MKHPFEQKAGLSLIIFTVLLVCTLVLHPAGGSLEHLMSITSLIVVTHSIALFSLPFGWIGFWGLSRKLGTDRFGSVLALAMVTLGLAAVFLAGATNGLVLPLFLQHAKSGDPETVKTIMQYSFAINHAFDYVYTFAFCAAILCWSIELLLTGLMAVWVGWLGIAVSLGTTILFISGMAVNNVQGLRVFGASMLIWILLIGLFLRKPSPHLGDPGL
jgi:hypothetical protein